MTFGPALLLGGLAGLVAGSFLATLILRWPQGRSVMRGRSSCDGCGRVLGPRELVPLMSALASGGKCRTCGTPIDSLHFSVELSCAAIGVLAAALSPGMEGAGWALLGWLLLTLAILDWRHFWLPDALTLPLAFLGLTVGPWLTPAAFADRVIGAAAGYGALLFLSLVYRRLRGRDGLGLGDAKLLAALGAWFGWQALPFILLSAASMGLAIALATGRATSAKARLPLGTFLAVAAIPGWIAASALLRI